jgi:hypothetical protein
MTKSIPTQDVLSDLLRVTSLLGHAPSYEDMRAYGQYGPVTYQRKLGPSWAEVKAKTGWRPEQEIFDPSQVSPSDGGWLAGIIDGEGCFTIQKPSPRSNSGLSHSYCPRFAMSLRTDDLPVLENFKRIVGKNTNVHIDQRHSSIANGMKANPAFKVTISDVPTLLFHLIPILELYPLRGKKKFEVPIFKIALQIKHNKSTLGYVNFGYTDLERSTYERLYLALSELKNFNANYDSIILKYNISHLLNSQDAVMELSCGPRYKRGPRPVTVGT